MSVHKRYEDGIPLKRAKIIDAVRIKDDTKVVLKLIDTEQDASIPILSYLNSEELVTDPRNKTIPLLDVLHLPDSSQAVIVMPVLHPFQSVISMFQCVSEVVEAFDQFIQGLVFMHEHRVAHRDACFFNLMVEPTKICPKGFHFSDPRYREDGRRRSKWSQRRSVFPLKYYFIDFEMAEYYPPEVDHPLCVGLFGQDKDVPEMSLTVPYDPFKLDVFQLGGEMTRLMKIYDGLDFLLPLTAAMKQQNPDKRLTAAETYQLFRIVVASLTEADLAQRIWPSSYPSSMRRPDPVWKRLVSPYLWHLCFAALTTDRLHAYRKKFYERSRLDCCDSLSA